MTRTMERLDLPEDTYHFVQEMAQARRITPSEFVTNLIKQFQMTERLSFLRQEYQQLAERAMLRSITRAEERRMDIICAQIEALNQQSEPGSAREQRHKQAEELIAKSEILLERAQQAAR